MRTPTWLLWMVTALALSASPADAMVVDQDVEYRLTRTADLGPDLKARFSDAQLSLLEKLNRVDQAHMRRIDQLVVPSVWKEELAHSPFPQTYPAAAHEPKFLVVDQPSQVFAAYEFGTLTRWGPVSSGRQAKPTPSGLFHLNWKTRARNSTLNGEWLLKWYFNFLNSRGLALHEYELPGVPMSHACVRLLARDAMWIYQWGFGWTLDAKGQLLETGTPVLIVGAYGFGAPPPWKSAEPSAHRVALPAIPVRP